MFSNIKIFKCYEHHSGTEPMSLDDYDKSISHTSYSDLVNEINKCVNNNFSDAKVLNTWQKQGNQTLDITSETYGQVLSNVRICILLKVSGNSPQADMETIMTHLDERIKALERAQRRTEGIEEMSRWHAKH